jgi:uncharacterized membrane protein
VVDELTGVGSGEVGLKDIRADFPGRRQEWWNRNSSRSETRVGSPGYISRMNLGSALLLVFGIGAVAGLRTMTAPAVVAWAAYLGWMNLSGSRLAFMGSIWAVGLLTLGALAEFFVDQLPNTPARTSARGLSARVVTGLLAGACVGVAAGVSPWLAAVTGAVGAIAGAFAGYYARVGLVRALRVPDIAVAIPEDLVAIGLGLLLVSRF